MKRTAFGVAAAGLLAASVPDPTLAADPRTIDWQAVPPKSVTLFYPGESTYDWLVSRAHKGARSVRQGKSCVSCHEVDEKDLGGILVKGDVVEPTPIPGKNGVLDVTVQAAHDAEYLYWRFQWKSHLAREGRMHDYVRFDGKQWKWYGHDRNDKAVRSGEQPPLYEDRFSIMLDDGKVARFAQQGCWLTCHDGMRDTRNEVVGDPVKKHPLLGADGLRHSDVRKYLASTRTDPAASWDKTRAKEEIAKLKAEGRFLDLMQWRAARSAPVGMADDGYVLEYRNFDAGKNPFSWNVERKTMTPLYMFDAAKVGFKALRAEDIGNADKPAAVVKEANAVPFDPKADWRAGDILPGRLLSRIDAKGSAADNDASYGTWKDGTYTLVWRRKLDTGNPADDKILKVGGKYTVGFAVHDDNVTTRFHHVSFPLTLGIGVDADITAVTLK
ncbi:MAG: ethylbenzene dehydrogenase-related protein [Burkholderiales bacterium]|nr:ethylbenzene dehydrogenase-related protein [Burkholderiales bacterium]